MINLNIALVKTQTPYRTISKLTYCNFWYFLHCTWCINSLCMSFYKTFLCAQTYSNMKFLILVIDVYRMQFHDYFTFMYSSCLSKDMNVFPHKYYSVIKSVLKLLFGL